MSTPHPDRCGGIQGAARAGRVASRLLSVSSEVFSSLTAAIGAREQTLRPYAKVPSAVTSLRTDSTDA